MESVVNASRRRALQLLAGAPMLPLSSTLAGASLLLAGVGADAVAAPLSATLSGVSFSSMSAPTLASAAAMATTTVGSVMSVSFSDKRKLD
ncbi:MAG TPA: alkaline phosphatase, partial [Polaromonas sp.]|nr:alkaline phosphatase [Polaromonas sp.]